MGNEGNVVNLDPGDEVHVTADDKNDPPLPPPTSIHVDAGGDPLEEHRHFHAAREEILDRKLDDLADKITAAQADRDEATSRAAQDAADRAIARYTEQLERIEAEKKNATEHEDKKENTSTEVTPEEVNDGVPNQEAESMGVVAPPGYVAPVKEERRKGVFHHLARW